MIVGPVMSVLAGALMLATLLWPSGYLAALSYFVFGAGPIVWTITSVTLRQTVTPKAMLGRVSAIFLTVNMGARPLGAALGGLVGESLGEGACLVLMLMGFAVQAAIVIASPIRHLQRLPVSVA